MLHARPRPSQCGGPSLQGPRQLLLKTVYATRGLPDTEGADLKLSKLLLRFGGTQRAAVRAACGIALGFTAPRGTRTEEVSAGKEFLAVSVMPHFL